METHTHRHTDHRQWVVTGPLSCFVMYKRVLLSGHALSLSTFVSSIVSLCLSPVPVATTLSRSQTDEQLVPGSSPAWLETTGSSSTLARPLYTQTHYNLGTRTHTHTHT